MCVIGGRGWPNAVSFNNIPPCQSDRGDRVAAFADDQVETFVAEMVEGRVVSAERVVTDVFSPSGQFDDLAETGPFPPRLLGGIRCCAREPGLCLWGNEHSRLGTAVDLDAFAKIFGADCRRMSPAPSTIEKEPPPSGSDDTRLRCQTEGW